MFRGGRETIREAEGSGGDGGAGGKGDERAQAEAREIGLRRPFFEMGGGDGSVPFFSGSDLGVREPRRASGGTVSRRGRRK